MNDLGLIYRLTRFEGKQLIDCADEIVEIAKKMGYTVNVIDPIFNPGSIDHEANRVNVRTDKDSKIVSFTIG